MHLPRYHKPFKHLKSVTSEKLSIKDISTYFTAFYFASLAIGGVIFYQYFANIHYLPTIEVSMIFWAVLFVFVSGFLLTITSLVVVTLPGLSLCAIDWLVGKINSSDRNEFRKHFYNFRLDTFIFLFFPWLVWPAYYHHYYKKNLPGIAYIIIFTFIVIAIALAYFPWLPKSINKYWRLFMLYALAVGTVVPLDNDISSFLYRKAFDDLPIKNQIDIFLTCTGTTYAFSIGNALGSKSKIGLTIGAIFGTIFFLLTWESPAGQTLSKAIMTNFKLGYTDVSLSLDKDYVSTLNTNAATSQLFILNNVISGKMLTRLGNEVVIEINTCNSCHCKTERNILCIPKDKIKNFVILGQDKL